MPTRKFTALRGGVVAGGRIRPVFIGNQRVRAAVLPVDAPKSPARNGPCACGSGKKYKKCCGG